MTEKRRINRSHEYGMTVENTGMRLDLWSECIGVLVEVEKNEDGAVLHFRHGQTIAVSTETGEELEGEAGNRIAVLRTDVPGKLYVWREVDAG